MSGEELREYNRKRMARWRSLNPERDKANRAAWMAEHPDYDKALSASHPGVANARTAAWRLEHPDACRLWRAANPERSHFLVNKEMARRHRDLGYVPLNSWFVGCEGHHINVSDVIYIPKELHRSVYHNQQTGQGMPEINALAGQYLTEDWT